MARTTTLKPSIIKTRSQSRTGTTARTGTNDDAIAPTPVAVATGRETIDRTIDVAPAPVAVATGGRTTGTNDPVPVVTTTVPVDLFASRPKTGTLKEAPPAVPTTGIVKPAPAPRDSDDDANKKPAAKPKPTGRPKKVVAPKTRKPRKPRTDPARTDPADDLVDPMSRVHVGDAGGLARAGGSDPVLADMDYSNPEQDPEQPDDEPQPKKKTRRAVE